MSNLPHRGGASRQLVVGGAGCEGQAQGSVRASPGPGVSPEGVDVDETRGVDGFIITLHVHAAGKGQELIGSARWEAALDRAGTPHEAPSPSPACPVAFHPLLSHSGSSVLGRAPCQHPRDLVVHPASSAQAPACQPELHEIVLQRPACPPPADTPKPALSSGPFWAQGKGLGTADVQCQDRRWYLLIYRAATSIYGSSPCITSPRLANQWDP